MRLRVSSWAFAIVILLFLIAISSCQYYQYKEGESGWDTGLRRSINATMDLSGFSMGEGSHSRYGEIGLAGIRVRDRTSSANGTLVYREGMHISSETSEDPLFDAKKPAGGQNWYVVVNETWPVRIDSYRSLDFSGRRINDLEYFGNNFEYAGSSVLYATELRKDTSVDLVLKDLQFNAIINDTLNRIIADEFRPNLTFNIDQRSSFKGLATFRFRHSFNRKPVSEGYERYWGAFTVIRSVDSAFINSTSPKSDYYLNKSDALECCITPYNLGECSLLILPFLTPPEVRT